MKHGPSKILLYVIAGLAGLIFLAWLADMRLKGVAMPESSLGLLGKSPGEPLTIDDMGQIAGNKGSGLPVLSDRMPEFSGIAEWLNSEPLTQASLRGKVVLIDFWTYSCINCIRTLPYVTSWHEKYKDKGFTVIGVHTPEFDFEKKASNVSRAIRDHGITYPVPLDNDYETWNAYDNRYWPAEYLFDAQGRLRYTHFGEGNYDRTEKNIQLLLAEAGMKEAEPVTQVDSTVDFSKIGTPETYVGYDRSEHLGSPEKMLQDRPQNYSVAEDPAFNEFYLGGTWSVHAEYATLINAPGEIAYLYQASNANLVMGGSDGDVRAEVTLDGAPVPEGMRGGDLYEEGGKTYVKVNEERLYNLIDSRGDYARRLLRIKFLNTGVRVYAFTFG